MTRVRARIQLLHLLGPGIPCHFPMKENEKGHPSLYEQEKLRVSRGN